MSPPSTGRPLYRLPTGGHKGRISGKQSYPRDPHRNMHATNEGSRSPTSCVNPTYASTEKKKTEVSSSSSAVLFAGRKPARKRKRTQVEEALARNKVRAMSHECKTKPYQHRLGLCKSADELMSIIESACDVDFDVAHEKSLVIKPMIKVQIPRLSDDERSMLVSHADVQAYKKERAALTFCSILPRTWIHDILGGDKAG